VGVLVIWCWFVETIVVIGEVEVEFGDGDYSERINLSIHGLSCLHGHSYSYMKRIH
jgi:hypothetical protein